MLARADEITAFRISPDGARIALVRETAGGVRARAGPDHPGREGHRRWLATGEPDPDRALTQVTQIADVAWLDANELLLLGAATDDAPLVPVRVAADASRVIRRERSRTTGGPAS